MELLTWCCLPHGCLLLFLVLVHVLVLLGHFGRFPAESQFRPLGANTRVDIGSGLPGQHLASAVVALWGALGRSGALWVALGRSVWALCLGVLGRGGALRRSEAL